MHCGHTKAKAPGETKDVSMFRFPADESRKEQWLKALGLKASKITKKTRICSRHFLNGDSSQVPSLDTGKRFASPKLRSKRCIIITNHHFNSQCIIIFTVLNVCYPQLTSEFSQRETVLQCQKNLIPFFIL